MIRTAKSEDASRIAEIYNYYIENTVVTFEEEMVSSNQISARLKKIEDSGLPWLVDQEGELVVGYAYASPWNERSAYKHTAEISVYLAHDSLGHGIGTRLYHVLFTELTKLSIKVVIGGIALPNPASKSLHEKFGMRKVAHFEKVGFKFGQWIDVGYWQTELNT